MGMGKDGVVPPPSGKMNLRNIEILLLGQQDIVDFRVTKRTGQPYSIFKLLPYLCSRRMSNTDSLRRCILALSASPRQSASLLTVTLICFNLEMLNPKVGD